jgi:hypothetical protein
MPLVFLIFLMYLATQTWKIRQTIWDKKSSYILVAIYLQLLQNMLMNKHLNFKKA